MTLRQLSPADISSVKDTLATYIRRVYLDKLPRDDGKALEADWSRRSCGVRELASRLLWRWPVVQQEAANHLSLNELARIYPPKGKQLGRLIGLDDVVLARHIFVGIVGFPDFIFSKLRQLHDFESVDEPPRKRGRATGSFADPVCASSATSVACASCAARCVSCEAGCTCTQWDMTNCAELDGVTNCYRCYAALCGTGATPKRVKHLLDGNPIIVSNAPTDELATPAAREMCETMMETMRTLAGRRTHATQYATSGGRVQVPLPRHLGWRTSTKQAKKKFFTSALKHLAEAPTVGPTNFDTYEKHVESSQQLFQEAENVVLNNLGIVLGIRINSEVHILDSVGKENLLGFVGSEEQPLHCDLPPDGTVQNLLALSRAKEATWMQRFRGGADAARAFLITLRNSDVRNQCVDERTFRCLLCNFAELAACAAAPGRPQAQLVISVPVYPGVVEVGHTTTMKKDANHFGPGVIDERDRGLAVSTVFIGSRPEFVTGPNSDMEPKQISGLVMCAMMGLHQVILTSASLQKQLNTPFYKELFADKAVSVGDLTPAEWNKLRNPECLPPAPTERATLAASSELRACRRPRRETDRDAPTDARTESDEAAFLADMRSDRDEPDESEPFSFR